MYEHIEDKVAYALEFIPNCQPWANGYLVKKYSNRWGIVYFANFFYNYWELTGRIIFENKIPSNMSKQEFYNKEYGTFIDEKYIEWLEIMNYDEFTKIWENHEF